MPVQTDPVDTFNLQALMTNVWGASPNDYTHVDTNASQICKSGSGVFYTLTINTRGSATAASLYDSVTASGSLIAVIDTTLSTTAFIYNLKFENGLTIKTAGVTAADLTVAWR